MIYYARTNKGNIRDINEDCIFAPQDKSGFFIVVADGMGGHKAGEVASRIVVETVTESLGKQSSKSFTKEHIKASLVSANKKIWEESENNAHRRGMGSTATVAAFHDNETIIGHVGDSRAYLFSSGILKQITKDHSYVQMLIDNGNISEDDAFNHPYKNIITRAVGISEDVDVDIFNAIFVKGDSLLLCTDGLNSAISDQEIADILNQGIHLSAYRLMEAALKRGGEDNISVVIAHMDGDSV